MSSSMVPVKLMAGRWDLKEIEWKDFSRIVGKVKQSPRNVRHPKTRNTKKIIVPVNLNNRGKKMVSLGLFRGWSDG